MASKRKKNFYTEGGIAGAVNRALRGGKKPKKKKVKPINARILGIKIKDNRRSIQERLDKKEKGTIGGAKADDFAGTAVGKLSSLLPLGQIRKMRARHTKTSEAIAKLKQAKKVASDKNKTPSTNKNKTSSTNKTPKSSALKISAKDKAEYLKRTRNSPAAKAGFSDDHRWELQKKHREWKKKHNRR